jgi:hypothetical protein
MKKIFTLFAFLICFGFAADAQTITRLVGASPFQDSLWVFDTTNFNVLRRLAPFPSSGGSLTGTNGIAAHPVTGQIFVVVKQSAVSGRVLGTLDPLTGLVTIVGNLGDNFSSITFNGNNTLLGVTGDGATVPETVYRIDQATAAKTVLRTMGNGADGEVICYNATDNMIYHWSGNGTIIYEKMDTSGVTITGIPIIGSTNGETFGMVFIGNNTFIGSNIGSRFQKWQANGTVGAQYGNTTPDDIRGTALITCSRAIAGTPAFCTGDSTLLTSQATNISSIQWFLNGALIPGATSSTYYASQVGHYNAIISDACGTDSLGTGIDVSENPLPVVNVSSAQTNLCPNDSIQITGTGGGTLQWYLNGNLIPSANSSSYFATAAGVYNMTKTNSNGCTDSAAVGVTIVSVPNPVVNIGNDTAICTGDSITLDAGNNGANFLWSPSGNSLQMETVSTAGPHAVTVTDGNGCSASDTLMLTVNPLPVVNIGNDTTFCGTSIVLDAGNPGASYLWCDGSTTQMITLSSSSVCMVYVTDANACTNTDTITVIMNAPPTVTVTAPNDSLCPAQPAMTLTLSPTGGTLTGPGISGSSFTPINAGPGTHTINYVYTDGNGCTSSDSVMITVFPIVNISMNVSSSTVCVDDANVTLTGSPSGGTFTGTGVSGTAFDPSIAGTGTFLITYMVTDTNSCNFATTQSVTVNACVGITEYDAANGTSLFPNPSNGNVTISLTASSSVMIFNTLGESVMSLQLAQGNHALDMTGLAEGIYFVRTQNANGASTQRLIISR